MAVKRDVIVVGASARRVEALPKVCRAEHLRRESQDRHTEAESIRQLLETGIRSSCRSGPPAAMVQTC